MLAMDQAILFDIDSDRRSFEAELSPELILDKADIRIMDSIAGSDL